jgi:hypothetical protein
VDSARAKGYKIGVQPQLFLSQLEDFKEASTPVKETRRTKKLKKLATLSSVNSKLIPHFPAKDLQCIVCTNNIFRTD